MILANFCSLFCDEGNKDITRQQKATIITPAATYHPGNSPEDKDPVATVPMLHI